MIRKILRTILLYLLFTLTIKAQSVTARVTNEENKPIPYVSIQIGTTYGVVSNEEGVFMISPSKADADEVTFSCIGFETLVIPKADLNNNTYILKEQVSVLDEVFVTNIKLSPLEILGKVIENAPKNYSAKDVKKTFFLRTSIENKLIRNKFQLVKSSLEKKSTLKDLNEELDEITKKNVNLHSQHYSESYGFLYAEKNETKLSVVKAIELKNKANDISGDQASNKLLNVVKRHLEPDATYKVKSGLFSIDDSLKIDSPEKDVITDEDTAPLKTNLSYLTNSLNKFYTNKDLDFFTRDKFYKYSFDGYATYKGEMIYIIGFQPQKSAAHYYGKFYVNASDYAIVKLEYNLMDGQIEKKVNLKFLIGIETMEDRTKVEAIFTKNAENKYSVNFVKRQKGTYTYIDRPLKFTKNKLDKKEETRMLKIDFLMEMDTYTTDELFIIDEKKITSGEFKNVIEKENYNIDYLSKYDSEVWKDYNVLAPVEAIKNYK